MTGKKFVEHYPSMFTEDKEWWAKQLDEHCIKAQIDLLNKIDDSMFQLLKDFPRETNQDAISAWNRTGWHNLIMNKISEFESLLTK